VRVLGCAVPAASAELPLGYNNLQLEYHADSTLQLFGGTFDSDNGWAVGASSSLGRKTFLWGRWATSGWDLEGQDDFDLESLSVGFGLRLPLRRDATPIDFILSLSYERLKTEVETELDHVERTDDGAGLKVGLRAGVTAAFEVEGYAYWVTYASSGSKLRDELDGLSFELGAHLALSQRIALGAVYTTGELDFLYLPTFEQPDQIEVDREELRLVLKYLF